MPGPDPDAISMDISQTGRLRVSVEMAFCMNPTARMNRAKAILRNLYQDRWCCRWCHEPVPLFRRADARFCGEGCRKKMARLRRNERRWT